MRESETIRDKKKEADILEKIFEIRQNDNNMRYANILHIDDDEDDQEIFLTALRRFTDVVGYTGLNSGQEALQKLTNRSLTPDIIFLDLNMPGMNGQQFLIELNKDSSLWNIPVVVLSTSAHKPTIHLMKELGAFDFITKPDNFDEFSKKLHQILS